MRILLIEDDMDDAELLEHALTSNGITYHLNLLKDGSTAVEYFKSRTDIPDIIILDYNLPKVHGKEVLLGIKANPSFAPVPLVILTTSSAQHDIDYAYKNGADKYLVKPTNLQQIKHMVDAIVELVTKEA